MPRTGRPPAITKAKEARIAELIWLAYTDAQIAAIVDVHQKTIQRARHGQICPGIQKIALLHEEPFRRAFWTGKQFPGGAAWMLERRYPTQFAKPEIQLSFQNNFTQNNLSIHITNAEARAIEAEASPVRNKVKEMFAQYRPALPSNGNGESSNGNGEPTAS